MWVGAGTGGRGWGEGKEASKLCKAHASKTAKTQSGWQSRVHFGQKINLAISLFFMDGLQVQYLFITSVKYLGAFASGFRDIP